MRWGRLAYEVFTVAFWYLAGNHNPVLTTAAPTAPGSALGSSNEQDMEQESGRG